MPPQTPFTRHDLNLHPASDNHVLMSDGGTGVKTGLVKQASLSLTPAADGEVLFSGGGDVVVAAKVSGRNVANLDDNSAIGGVPVVYSVVVPDGATAAIDKVITYKVRVIDVSLIKTGGDGGASDTITVQNGSAAITDAMSINVVDKTVVRAATIDDANYSIAAGGTLRVVRTKVSAANVACVVHIHCIQRA